MRQNDLAFEVQAYLKNHPCAAVVIFQVRLHFKGKVILPHGDLQRTETLHQATGIFLCL